MIPPEQNADFVAHMEDILDVYHRSYDQKYPLVCMDEQPIQMVKETRESIPGEPGKPMRYDYQYERAGVANAFMFCEPLAGQRYVAVRETRTAKDWAHEIKKLLEQHYPNAEKIVLVMDNLNTHTTASLYKTFPPQEAKRLADRLEIHYTPKHGSWLNIAEIELSVMTKQCLDRYIPDIDFLTTQVNAWNNTRNKEASKVDWQFSNDKARIKLKRIYPVFSD